MTHVDVVKNEWLAGVQYPVAQIRIEAGHVIIDSEDPERWRDSLMRAVGGLDPDLEPERFLSALSGALDGSYLFATEPHEEHQCPFHGHGVLHMRAASGLNGASRVRASGAGQAATTL